MLTQNFLRRGYPKHLVLKPLEHTKLLKRETLLNKETLKENLSEPEDKKFYCVTTHNPLNLPFRDTIAHNREIVGKTKTSHQLLIVGEPLGQKTNIKKITGSGGHKRFEG